MNIILKKLILPISVYNVNHEKFLMLCQFLLTSVEVSSHVNIDDYTSKNTSF